MKITIEIEIEVEYDHDHGEAGCTSGPPERCYEGSDPETTITSATFGDIDITKSLTEANLREIQEACEEDAQSKAEGDEEDAALSRYESRMEARELDYAYP